MVINRANDLDASSFPMQESLDHSDHSDYAPLVLTIEERDEVLEVQKMSMKATDRVRKWRLALAIILLIAAGIVTITTYQLLVLEQERIFETSFDQFALTVRQAALEQQHNIREAFVGFSSTMTAYAKMSNSTWPFVTLPLFEAFAENALIQSRAELFGVCNIVSHENQEMYTEYANNNRQWTMEEAHHLKHGDLEHLDPIKYSPFIYRPAKDGPVPDIDRESYCASWTSSPPSLTYGLKNFNFGSIPDYDNIIKAIVSLTNETLFTRVRPYAVAVGTVFTPTEHDAMHAELKINQKEHPHSIVWHPIHKELNDDNSEIVGLISAGIAWDASLRNLLPEAVFGIHAVIRNTCNQRFTYEIKGKDAIFLGQGDHHDPKYYKNELVADLSISTNRNFSTTPGHCRFSMHIFPTEDFERLYRTITPAVFAIVVAITFVFVGVVFFIYDVSVQRRNVQLVANAARSNAIVSSMFPANFRDRLIGQNAAAEKEDNLKSFMVTGNESLTPKGHPQFDSKPLADLFLETTVMFADIVGFTAWSSVREPTQVFTLLEAVYNAFDQIAKKHGVFKVETVGDCYVAAAGLPDPRKDHAIAIARFARDIMCKMKVVTKELEVTLGPDTGDLALRIGIHSGPVTGGVLRGERFRFQLFGDTMNTTARMETTGEHDKIQISHETAQLLVKSHKGSWITRREDTITAKGKGDMETYWLTPRRIQTGDGTPSVCGSESTAASKPALLSAATYAGFSERTSRLIDWNVETLSKLIKLVVAHRMSMSENGQLSLSSMTVSDICWEKQGSLLDEIREIITLPEFNSRVSFRKKDPDHVELPGAVVSQLREYVICIAGMYRGNAFHNFEHASHVHMSVIKLLSRIVAPSNLDLTKNGVGAQSLLHDHTYGITSDPLTQFACAFSVLVHDVDHSGVPNEQLVKENKTIAALYHHRSVAEQNSLELSWDLLMEDRFSDLRSTLYTTEEELCRFRQLVVNGVMATDIVDKDLKKLRNDRWEKAFTKDTSLASSQDSRDAVNRKATIVIEHLIQASDVAHTMQHWHVYRKWNERFFEENYTAYLAGRAERDPSEYWYQGEIGFFDFYIIPLAKKLKECGVFGKSSGEYLNYALINRREWETQGEAVVATVVEVCKDRVIEKV